jgi:hypothetical protein
MRAFWFHNKLYTRICVALKKSLLGSPVLVRPLQVEIKTNQEIFRHGVVYYKNKLLTS